MSSIQLHKEHGLNPTIAQCILCGEDKNEIALLGNKYKGQAPMHMVIGIEPCDNCKTKYLHNGVMLVEANERKNPTGKITVLKDEAFKRIFNTEIPPKKIAFVEIGLLSKLGV